MGIDTCSAQGKKNDGGDGVGWHLAANKLPQLACGKDQGFEHPQLNVCRLFNLSSTQYQGEISCSLHSQLLAPYASV